MPKERLFGLALSNSASVASPYSSSSKPPESRAALVA